jgi:hypothetical protein
MCSCLIVKKFTEKKVKAESSLYTVCLLRELAPFGEREKDLLRGRLGDGTLEVGRDVNGAIWAVYLQPQHVRRGMKSVTATKPTRLM